MNIKLNVQNKVYNDGLRLQIGLLLKYFNNTYLHLELLLMQQSLINKN